MREFLNDLDARLFLALNGDAGAFMDEVMWYASKTWPWVPVYASLLYLLYRRYTGRRFLVIVAAVAVCVTLTDRFSTGVLKDSVKRLRPSREASIHRETHFVRDENGNEYIGGMYGFVSSHAANYAGIIAFFILMIRPLKRSVIALLVAWTLLIGYSRIYLGVHYPGDVVCGYLLGAAIGWGVAQLTMKVMHSPRFNPESA